MPDLFTWCPLVNPTGQTTLRVRKAQFGDGYSQRVPDGINTKVQSWPVSFRGNAAYTAAIKAFLDVRLGATAFLFTPPNNPQGLYVCESYTEQAMGAGMYTLSATFQQVFAP